MRATCGTLPFNENYFLVFESSKFAFNRQRARSFLHAAHNNYDQAVFSVITAGADRMFFVSETGLLTILCAWVLAIILYLRFKRRTRPGATEGHKAS